MNFKLISFRLWSVVLIASLLFASCESMTVINSEPQGAHLFLNNEYVGVTPYTHVDDDIVFTKTYVRLELDGYEPLQTSFTRDEDIDVGAACAGLFCWLPWLWVLKYDENHTYTLIPTPLYYDESVPMNNPSNSNILNKADQLRELKRLLDEGIITKEEFEKEKLKILEQE